MSPNNSKKDESKQDTKPQVTSETNSQTTEGTTSSENGAPLVQQQQTIMDLFRNALNPNGEYPQVDEYLTSTFSYVQNVFNKMQTAEDKDATAKEIAEDLTDRFDKWMSEQQNKNKNSNKQDDSGKDEKSDEPLKVEEVD
ncbi:uncharacterized protein AC631_05250 [Debaryomyces fabryi]|uniref:Uncharacterized protein n=1 Tax=Debaryomyces fabryi TaxID=58627 RepID=A0A0V1PRW4_9ASCO|nr:uncharacterized protein AC631_05250 [Debaryomyces fabryi]KRZ98988.1 hypothetical protein AC631_05250 [Debaryomyces fabryi]CUM45497.1 unnamed protein product [Debaryomyces fabryi]